jgi:hypothetical protein
MAARFPLQHAAGIVPEAANVQWVSGHTFALAFFRITKIEQQRLGQVIDNLMEVGEERADH